MSLFKSVRTFFDLIKFEHTVFALPFAYLGMTLAKRRFPGWPLFLLITLAMVTARTAGMTLNRIFDVKIDAQNPRTQNRPSVTGAIPISACWIIAAASIVIFFISTYFINPFCFRLSFVALALLTGYHFVKRFSYLCHFALGAVLGMAPIGGWFAVSGRFEWPPVFLGLAVMLWTAGFDILYSMQDIDFDRANKLHSVPAKFGAREGFKIAAACHISTVAMLGFFGIVDGLGIVYWAGVAMVAILLKVEHSLISEEDLTNINAAFFTINGWIGILLLVFTFLEIL